MKSMNIHQEEKYDERNMFQLINKFATCKTCIISPLFLFPNTNRWDVFKKWSSAQLLRLSKFMFVYGSSVCCSYTTNCYHISLPWKAPKFGDREASLAPSLSPCQTPHLPYRGYKVPAKSGTLSTATFCKAVSNISRKRMCILPSANILLCTCGDAEHTIYVTSALSTV